MHKRSRAKSGSGSAAKPRRSLRHTSPEMQHWAALLAGELTTWPRVTSRPMFGMQVFYRADGVFALLPAKRSLGSPNSIGFKLQSPTPGQKERLRTDASVHGGNGPAGWYLFEVKNASDLKAAMQWFEQAYKAAGHEPHFPRPERSGRKQS